MAQHIFHWFNYLQKQEQLKEILNEKRNRLRAFAQMDPFVHIQEPIEDPAKGLEEIEKIREAFRWREQGIECLREDIVNITRNLESAQAAAASYDMSSSIQQLNEQIAKEKEELRTKFGQKRDLSNDFHSRGMEHFVDYYEAISKNQQQEKRKLIENKLIELEVSR